MLYGDRPIKNSREDLLGRSGFALELARAIDKLTVTQGGFVISILGEWGAGKSSVIELIIRYLRHIEMADACRSPLLHESSAHPRSLVELEEMSEVYEAIEPHILEMGALNLNLTYWDRIDRRSRFNKWLKSEESGAIADQYFQLLLFVEENPRNIVIRFSPWLISGKAELSQALLSELARGLDEKLGNEVATSFGKLLQRLSEFAPVAGSGLDLISPLSTGKLLSAVGTLTGGAAKNLTEGPTLDQTRQQLNAALRRRKGQKVVVIVDDLDRLTPHEALEMVSLVKSLGDLPNVVYLLSYSESELAQLIKSAINIDGHSFLEKIVQYPKHLPVIEQAALSSLLNADLERLLPELTPEEQKRLGNTWYLVFQHYLTTPRHVRRFANSLSVSLAALSGHVNPVDLALLTVLELHEPEIYAWLRRDIDLLVN